MAVIIKSSAFNGINGRIVDVEIDIAKGLPAFNIVGLGSTSIKEAKERVRAAIVNSGFQFPMGRITVNLAPADMRKEGSLFDLPIAIGILIASNQMSGEKYDKYLIIGELSLNGELKKVKGVLSIVLDACGENINRFIVPNNNKEEASAAKQGEIYPFGKLKEVVEFLKYEDMRSYSFKESLCRGEYREDFSEIIGQKAAKRALEIAAAGNHNIIMYGPPGSGKSMLASRIPTILPGLTYDESLEVTKIYSVAGKIETGQGMIKERPFRSPHHTITKVGLVGGGNKLIPGEVSLSHNGVLFLDEMLEFKKYNLDLLRQPMEEKKITITREAGSVIYPCNFMLVAAMNPCECGYYGSGIRECKCTFNEVRNYLRKISGPMLDRFDMFINVNSIKYKELKKNNDGESSDKIRERVERARKIQVKRFKDENNYTNSGMSSKQVRKYCEMDEKCSKMMEKIYDKFNLSSRVYIRILKVARTIADLENKDKIEEKELIEALEYRKFINENYI